MAKGFDKLNVKSAVKSRNSFDLSRTHLTTMDFGQIVPLFCEETVPGDKFTIEANYFSRMAPLVKPTYGKFYFKTMQVFVPYFQVCDGIDAWITGMNTWEGDPTKSRWITNKTLIDFVTDTNDVSDQVEAEDIEMGTYYDFHMVNASGTDIYYRLTAKGKFWMKVLNSLGYVLPDGVDLRTTSNWYKGGLYNKKMSALPILAFAKGYNDWMSQSQRYNSSWLTKMLKSIKNNISVNDKYGTSAYDYTTQTITKAGVKEIMNDLVLCYENDYFTSAWMNPNAATETLNVNPKGQVGASTMVNVPGTDDKNNIWSSTSGEFLESIDEDSSGVLEIYQRGLDFLKSFDDWVKRNNYSGSRAVQQVYSRFGIKTDDYTSNYAHVINTDSIPVQVGDVTALSQDFVSNGSNNNLELGDYAGKGILSGNNTLEYQAKDYGMLFIFGWYTVDPMNVYGADKHVLRTTPIEYYTPEFDGLGAEAISIKEVFSNPRIKTSNITRDDAVFGFTERYNSYRYGKDKITGDFRKLTLPSSDDNANVGTEMNVWHTGRMLTDLRTIGALVAQNPAFNTLDQVNSEYDRIFSITDGSVDHFYVTAQFKVKAIRPMLSLNQVPGLGEGDTVISKNGNEIN